MILRHVHRWAVGAALCWATVCLAGVALAAESDLQKHLDSPLLFVKRHSYTGIHIYDTYYKWPPGGGGIYLVENPSAPRAEWRIRPVIDPTTPGTLGFGVYTHPELSWDAKKLLFCFKGEPSGSTSVYQINVDGTGLRRLSDPTSSCACYKGTGGGQHDIAPAYLPDGRIVLLSTRPSGLVPCANEGVSILHVMNADGTDLHPISVNNVNEFDPSVLPDGRILFGRWEYVDKNALTIQSLWTINPDGTQETAFYANNMVFPEAILDARAVPGSPQIVGTFAKHNGTPRGTIALVDPRKGKNDIRAITNLEYPDNPTRDTGDSCEPWPVTSDVFLYSGRPAGQTRNVLQMIDRAGRRTVLLSDPEICLHSPMLVKPRSAPATIVDTADRRQKTGRFFVQDIYRGLKGVRRGEVKHLRIVEETSRVSPTTMGGSPYNQVFLVSAALAFSVKNVLGVVPVEADGSAYFEAPSGRALFFQALDAEGRLVQSMRTFVQASPGTTRSCVGCHEYKYSAAGNEGLRSTFGRMPSRIEPESWGSGYIDFTERVQPVLDKQCVSCHGGEKDIAGGMDLSGGWTEHFSIGYESLANRRHTQLIAHWIAGIDCMNGTALWSSKLFEPRGHGSGSAPLAELLARGHNGYIAGLSRKERDLLMAWIDTNGLYYGTWDYTQSGCTIKDWNATTGALVGEMQSAGCLRCHGDGKRASYFENDWINLKDPEKSRILRAPLAAGGAGSGLAWCRDRKVDPKSQRIHLLWNGYAHAVQPPEAFPKHPVLPPDRSGKPTISFTSTGDAHYQTMLAMVREAREKALAAPRIDMPGAEAVGGACRNFNPPPLPAIAPPLEPSCSDDGLVHLAWERSAATIGLDAELHRSSVEGFTPNSRTLLLRTTLARYTDRTMPVGKQYYALVFSSMDGRSKPSYASVTVPAAPPPAAPSGVKATPASGSIRLSWSAMPQRMAGYHVFRGKPGDGKLERLTVKPEPRTSFIDARIEPDVSYAYAVCAVGLRGAEGPPTAPVQAAAKFIRPPVFTLQLDGSALGQCYGGELLPAKVHGSARVAGGTLDVRQGGHLAFAHRELFDLAQPFSLECWVWIEKPGPATVLASCGQWQNAGWFLQQIGGQWRWHVGGVDCDGGPIVVGRWCHLVGIFDGRAARLYADGAQVAERAGSINTASWPGELCIGQYSADQSANYQTNGRIAGLKIYHRPLTPEEIAKASKSPPK